MIIHWVRKGRGLQKMGAAGWSYANEQLQKHLALMGALDDEAPVAVHFGVPRNFWPLEGKANVMFTMWESSWQLADDVAPVVRERRPDAVLVPCDWNRDGLRRLVPDVPVETVPLGFDDELITYRRRRWKPRQGRFRWGFLGAPNYRKYSLARNLYAYLHSRRPLLRARGIDFEFYWKFSGGETTNERIEKAKQRMAGSFEELEPGLWRGSGKDPRGLPADDWVIDNRFIDRRQVVELYYSFHAFCALHTGEGFGLNALEAMASGCPTMVTDYSGTTQFANPRNAFTIPGVETTVLVPGPEGPIEKPAVLPDLKVIGETAIEIMADYYAATERAKRGAADARRFTWRRSAATLCETLAGLRILSNVSTC